MIGRLIEQSRESALSNAQWLLRFAVMLMPLVWLAALFYLPWISVEGPLAPVYLAMIYVGHLSLFPLLSLAPMLLFVHLPAALFRLISSIIATLMLMLLLVDALVYELYRFHINTFVLEMVILSGTDTFDLPTGMHLIAVGVLLVVIVAVALMVWLALRVPRWLVGVAMTVLLVSLTLVHGIHAWSDAVYDTRITGMTRHIPLYYGTTSKRFFVANGLIDPEKARRDDLALDAARSNLRYPLEPMTCSDSDEPLNVLIILVDALRADTVTPMWMPNIAGFRERASDYSNHFSGGNSTLAGVFSMFYGLPSNYWDAFYGAQHPPVMIERVMKLGYQSLVLSSATLVSPAFDRTVFSGVPDIRLRTPGKSMWQKDQLITDDWLAFTAARQATDAPFFGFIFYSAVHAYGPPDDYPRFEPYWEKVNHLELSNSFDPEPYLNVYRTAAHYVDSQIGRVLEDLDRRGLLDSTVVMISSDHGEEFNDNGLDFWGHGSNFSDIQLHVPMVVHWPHRDRQQVSYRTTHHDVPVTFLEEVLGCGETPAEHYSVGRNMFDPSPRDLLIVGSYANYAAVLEDHIVVSYPGGGHDVLDKKLNKAMESVLQPEISRRILTQLSRFYR